MLTEIAGDFFMDQSSRCEKLKAAPGLIVDAPCRLV
jgi:hypothetical protein